MTNKKRKLLTVLVRALGETRFRLLGDESLILYYLVDLPPSTVFWTTPTDAPTKLTLNFKMPNRPERNGQLSLAALRPEFVTVAERAILEHALWNDSLTFSKEAEAESTEHA